MGLLYDRIVRTSFGVRGEPFTVVDKLFTQFEVEKTSEKFPNRVRIQIANLNETSRATLQRRDVIVKLDAGYQGQPDELFLGNISKAASVRNGRDWITTIEAGDGQNAFKSQINRSLGPGATGQQVVEELAGALRATVGVVKGISDEIFQNGIVLSGDVEKRLDEITQKMGVEWSIQDEKLTILPPDQPSEELGIVLAPETGLIGTPFEREDKDGAGKFLEFRSLLRAQIRPGVSVRVNSEEVDGFFKIRKATYTGDNRKGPFEVLCEGKEVPSGAIEGSQQLNVNIGAIA